MKLNPPASSSDLEAAREIARRLHQRRRREDRLEPEDDAPAPRGKEPLAPARRPDRPVPVEPPPPTPPPSSPPSWDAPVGEAVPNAALDPLAGIGGVDTDEEPALDVGGPEVEVEAPALSPDEMVGADVPEPLLTDLPEAAADGAPPSPFDIELAEAPEEEMVDVPAPPSWDDVVVSCLALAGARGAMLVGPAGQVLAARGEWPEPGPDAIASKLVATMDRTLKDAPTRSISAPLMGKQLTAWRVPLPEGLVTAAFIGDAPVRAEARPAIDGEVRGGPGA